MFNKPVKISGADEIYATNKNRTFNTENKILSDFVPKGKKGKNESNLKKVHQVVNNKRVTVIEETFGKQKNIII